ncbi:hypothetical protein [Bradyrhizobium sp.]|nr:hypothetical protein [Bradyrhizobium sp.]
MRAPIRGAIVYLMKRPGKPGQRRIDWTLVLAWAGVAIALWIIALVVILR